MNSDICCGCEIAMKACQVETCSVPGTQIRMARWKLETLTRQVVKQIFCFELFPRWLYFLMGMHGCKYIYIIYIYILCVHNMWYVLFSSYMKNFLYIYIRYIWEKLYVISYQYTSNFTMAFVHHWFLR
jgi:hypothetical protein